MKSCNNFRDFRESFIKHNIVFHNAVSLCANTSFCTGLGIFTKFL
nr:MAG TPA_asm: hypothetical protein [Caudoviricetes sp.]